MTSEDPRLTARLPHSAMIPPQVKRRTLYLRTGHRVTVPALKTLRREDDRFFAFQMINSLVQRDQIKFAFPDGDSVSSEDAPLRLQPGGEFTLKDQCHAELPSPETSPR